MTSSRNMIFGPSANQFVWASGMENTFVVQARKGHRSLDEYELMGHYAHWKEDLLLTKQTGVTAIRWGVPWYRVEPKQGEFDWTWTDEVIPFIVEELGLVPIIDLMHYGCPLWLNKEFINREYPVAVARYAGEFAKRYHSLVRHYTPLNEPVVNALWCGKRGVWPPYLKGDSGYIRMMLQISRGILNTINAIREVDPEAIMVHVEATGLSKAASEELEALAVEDSHKNNLCLDLITGKITRDHPLIAWLIRNGTSIRDIQDITNRAITIDVLGLNFYPQWSTQQLYIDSRGRLAYRAHEQDGAGFGTLIRDFQHRYNCPIMITETSAFGSHELRLKWLTTSLSTVKELRADGVPVVGYTWFPMCTMVDWRYRFGHGPKEQYRMELGLFKLNGEIDNIPTQPILDTSKSSSPPTNGEVFGRWSGTPLITEFKALVENPVATIGEMPSGSVIFRDTHT